MSNNNDIFVREAHSSDDHIVEIHRQASQDESHRYRGTTLDIPMGHPVVTVVAGFGSTTFASLRCSQISDKKWHIHHVFVEADAREIGIGDAMMNFVLNYLVSQQAQWVGSSVLPGDRSMKNLFERHGLVAQTIIVGKSLSNPST